MKTALVILAAGKGTRMNSDLPKVLHPLAGAPLLVHAMRAGGSLAPDHTVIVAGHGIDAVRDAALDHDETAIVVEQSEQLGTAHAAAQARSALTGFGGTVIVDWVALSEQGWTIDTQLTCNLLDVPLGIALGLLMVAASRRRWEPSL